MFRINANETRNAFRPAIIGLLTLSIAAFAVTVWVMTDFLHEREIVHQLISKLPPDAALDAAELESELLWQFRLSILVVLNLVVTALAVALLGRAYGSSQESLRDIKSKAGDIISSMDLAVITTDIDGLVTSINRRGIEFLELDRDFVGLPLSELSDSFPLEDFRCRSNGEEPHDVTPEDFASNRSAVPRVLRAFCQPLRDHREQVIGNIIQLREVTERVLIEERLRRMERYMGLGSLAAGLHHEIKNPLAALSLHVQLLGEELDGTIVQGEVHQMLSVIRTEIARVSDVLENFRDFASIGRLETAQLNLAPLIDRQIKLIAPQAAQQKIKLEVDADESLPQINADRVRLEQVLLNLLVNAMEAMPDGGTLTVRAQRVISQDLDVTVQLQITDTGIGIPENIRDCVFDPYFTTKNKGTGMGLALCDKIVRQHGGSIEFHSSKDGTLFEVTLPAEPMAAAAARLPDPSLRSDESGVPSDNLPIGNSG